MILSFHDSKYGKCLKLLDDIKDNLLLDLYLAGHVNQLYSMIRNRSLVQYFRYENRMNFIISIRNKVNQYNKNRYLTRQFQIHFF